jgi:hypothetical protein
VVSFSDPCAGVLAEIFLCDVRSCHDIEWRDRPAGQSVSEGLAQQLGGIFRMPNLLK